MRTDWVSSDVGTGDGPTIEYHRLSTAVAAERLMGKGQLISIIKQ